MGSVKWTLIAVGYQCALAYAAALLVNTFGNAIFDGGSWVPAIVSLVAEAVIVFVLCHVGKNKTMSVAERAVDAR